MARFVRLCCLVLSLSSCWLAPANVALADAASDARSAFQRGVAATREGRWQEARDEFERSRSLVVKPSTLFNLAVADLKLGLAAEALAALDAFESMATVEDHGAMLERARTLREEAERSLEAARPAGERARGLVDPSGLAKAQHAAFEEGRDAYARGDDQLALDKFTEAYASSNRAELLYDIGMVADRLREDQRAIEAFEQFVRDRPNAPEAALAKKRIDRLKRELARQESGSSVAIAEGHEESFKPHRDAPALNLTGPRTVIAVGAVLAVGSLATLGLWAERSGALDDCQRADQTCDNKSTIESHVSAAKIASIGLGVSAAALLIGGGVWLSKRKHATHVTAFVLPQRAGFALGGSARLRF